MTIRLTDALIQRETTFSKAIETIRDASEEAPDVDRAAVILREAVELVRCLRRLLPGRTTQEIYRAFGAPGDFGYETPIGAALAKVYRGDE